ncbi:UDP-N-acetylglucosamine--N-acetylmuramyl-(pentapeptide) pyrophosphoryl-undecaprenol N-acetylglucosamine transferase 1 [Insulibacter thermoxylanivorax]|uniref:UDP-N-acetylglucosamine--N-acetylmuramyl-(pentapeptide) pyrophosphoryl-undecaprenol N-acetylglucosamine transferase n=1 Tax=Insulibacter thermoxylanivorax TaxID=2749268 RepID=A0A916QFB6_9BACL|nr:undecaprenyldiphospho-muramoylpentapeptide beta-N-acetylglucosaminyltransferase [Insulibacter thermoxylanivorax]GFR37471.1 UDP-N-acetylglucosamine--N-acetylmuramyl-(pentapeptide) pyrophosphoryl-undecaprenol N-acetylglucosamine transferase 1 [Insulibacter thermoxylanivorax]
MRVVLTGGGTGGHIYPALAIARQVTDAEPGSELLYIGSNRGLERELAAKEQIPFEAIEISGFRRSLSWENVRTILRFVRGVRRSKQLLRRFQPDIVVGTGGYVCGPVVYAAVKLGIPTVLHEQNVIPGLTNAFLSRYADLVAVSFPESSNNFPRAKRVLYTGNPRASQVVHADGARGLESLGMRLAADEKLVIVMGGSRGAKAINDSMIEMAPLIAAQPSGLKFVFITGQPYFESTMSKIREQLDAWPEALKVVPYVHNMPEVLAAASLIVSRSGASSLAEITALGLPSILIPSPNVTNNHQEANARWLEREGAAKVILERDLDGRTLYDAVCRIADDAIRFEHMSRMSKKLGKPDAAEAIYEAMCGLIRGQNF